MHETSSSQSTFLDLTSFKKASTLIAVIVTSQISLLHCCCEFTKLDANNEKILVGVRLKEQLIGRMR